jgi:molecular chaperone GrpE
VNRDEILRCFEQWLDEALAAADPPSGIDAEILASLAAESGDETIGTERRSDAYALWATITALTQEVKLQGRAFRELSDGLGSQAGRIAEEIRAVYLQRERDLQRDVERRCRREILSGLVDLRDRLSRGLDSIRATESEMLRAATPGWLKRVWARPGDDALADRVGALTKGYELGIERLDQTLDDFGARHIHCDGQSFDPRRMNAVDREESSEVPEGTVLEVYRSGYEWNGEVFRPAQVKVSCAPAASIVESGELKAES